MDTANDLSIEWLAYLNCMAMRLQSAMEYLMTYGWAILILAVVLVSLAYLGVFNSATAQPNVCNR